MSKSVRMIGTAQTQKWHRTCTCGNMRTLNWTFEPLTWNHLKITCSPCTVLWNLKVIQGPTVGRPTPSISSWRWQVAPAKALADPQLWNNSDQFSSPGRVCTLTIRCHNCSLHLHLPHWHYVDITDLNFKHVLIEVFMTKQFPQGPFQGFVDVRKMSWICTSV